MRFLSARKVFLNVLLERDQGSYIILLDPICETTSYFCNYYGRIEISMQHEVSYLNVLFIEPTILPMKFTTSPIARGEKRLAKISIISVTK